MKSEKKNANEIIYKTEINPPPYKANLWLPKGKGERYKQEDDINKYTLLCIKQISNKDLLHNTGNYTQYFVITYKEKNLKNNVHN